MLSPHYVIPKKSIQCLMQELTLSSHRKEITDIFYNSFNRQQQENYHIETVYRIENSDLIKNFLEVRSQLRLSSHPSGLSSSFNYGFIEVSDLQEAELIAKSGVLVRKQPLSSSIYLGSYVNGIFLSLFGDFTSKDKPVSTSSHFIVICKLALTQDCVQWVRPVSDKNEQPPRLPTDKEFGANAYMIGRHLVVGSMCQSHQDPEWVESFEVGLIYLWDHDAQLRPRLPPRHCLPIAVIHYSYHDSKPSPQNDIHTILPINRITTASLYQQSIGSSLQPKNDSVHNIDPLSPAAILFQTDKLPFDALLNKQEIHDKNLSQEVPPLPSHLTDRHALIPLWKKFREATLLASQLWSGLLYNGNHKLCLIKLRTYYPPSFPLHFSEVINIELATSFDLFYKEFPQGLFSVAYPMLSDPKVPSPIVIKNNSIHYAEVCPHGGAAIPILNALISHLQDKTEVAYAYIDDNTCIYFIPTSPLTQHLKITHPSHPNILHALIYRLLPPVLSSSGVSTSPQVLNKSRVVKPIPTHITSRTHCDNHTRNGSLHNGPYPFILQRFPRTTTRTIGTQCSSPPSCQICHCRTSTYVDAACQTSIDEGEEDFHT
ncbi:hypothetical protein LOD99_7056 [Oopsacas minuta]|uniref:Uncharacterized protein n=1 Tax=Oopsacas minuta TaxID=111878 RepID=A0AAV7JIR7_9METZ|nr:hypothetical protein LOD99_7056 [Oopsacas minuta]